MKVDQLPVLGVGIGYRSELRSFFARHENEIEWFELIADRYFRALPESSDWLVDFREAHRLVPHGLDLSLGTDEKLELNYTQQATELCALVRAPFYSDHLCMTQAGGVQLGHLTPLPFDRRTAHRVAEKAKAVQDLLGVPFLLENIAYSFALPGEMSEADFVASVVEEADCGLLLDLTNLFVNSENHGYDAYEYLRRLPLERVVQIHLAGSERHRGKWVDAHSRSVEAHPEVWSLLEFTVRHAPVRAVLLERDQDFPEDPSELIADLRRARQIFAAARCEQPEPRAPSMRVPSFEDLDTTGAATARSPGSLELQSALAEVLVDRRLRGMLRDDPQAFAKETSLHLDAVRALEAAGLEELDDFASSLENKRFGMLNRSSPALFKLLEQAGMLEHVRTEFARRCPPKEALEYANRTIRDACWAQELVGTLVSEGVLEVKFIADVARYENLLLRLGSERARVDSAKYFDAQRGKWTALSDAELLDAFPRMGAHAAIEAFSCDVTAVVRALMDGRRVPPESRCSMRVLIVKLPGARNVLSFEVNALTERLLVLADGSRSGAELADELGRWSPDFGPAGRLEKTAKIVRRLVERNVLAIDRAMLA